LDERLPHPQQKETNPLLGDCAQPGAEVYVLARLLAKNRGCGKPWEGFQPQAAVRNARCHGCAVLKDLHVEIEALCKLDDGSYRKFELAALLC
jgi:hypothetical protein